MTPVQIKQFNRMRKILRRISKSYLSPDKLRAEGMERWGLGPDEVIEFAYENVKHEAALAVKGVEEIKTGFPTGGKSSGGLTQCDMHEDELT